MLQRLIRGAGKASAGGGKPLGVRAVLSATEERIFRAADAMNEFTDTHVQRYMTRATGITQYGGNIPSGGMTGRQLGGQLGFMAGAMVGGVGSAAAGGVAGTMAASIVGTLGGLIGGGAAGAVAGGALGGRIGQGIGQGMMNLKRYPGKLKAAWQEGRKTGAAQLAAYTGAEGGIAGQAAMRGVGGAPSGAAGGGAAGGGAASKSIDQIIDSNQSVSSVATSGQDVATVPGGAGGEWGPMGTALAMGAIGAGVSYATGGEIGQGALAGGIGGAIGMRAIRSMGSEGMIGKQILASETLGASYIPHAAAISEGMSSAGSRRAAMFAGAGLSGAIFGGNRRSHRRGFNSSRGSRI